eukprot:PITA_12894
MQDHDLIDVVPKNRRFTWNNRSLHIHPPVHSFISLPHIFDSVTHCSLVPIPFKYSPLWNDNSTVKSILQSSWQQHIEGSPGYIWESKIKRVKYALKEWEKNCYTELEIEKREIKAKLEDLHSTIEGCGFQQEDKDQEDKLYCQLYRINREEEQKWRIKSRKLWLKGGDKNSAFFHKKTTARKIRNNITSIVDREDNLQTSESAINKEINENLSKEIEEEEIRGAIWALQRDIAPGPDEFPICFYRAHWGIIRKDLIKMMKWIQRKGKIGGYTNSTYLALILKENHPTTFSRFRPISLCNSSYKILTKILATRLKPLLPSLISENQGGFLANRQISDSILLVQEIHSNHYRKEKGFILKLDLANAFDRVRHSFLIVVLKKMVFARPLLDLIKAYIMRPWISPLVNGRPRHPFQSSRGLRQGCPLSPYLFILMVESFSKALDYKR